MIIETRTLGSRKRPFEPWEISLLTDPAETLTLEHFIRRIVRQEVAAFRERQEMRKLTRVLSREVIAEGAARGKVSAGGRDLAQEVDADEAVEDALLAFRDGFYYVFIDGVQIESLEASFDLSPATHVLFVRLVPLVGG